MEWIQSLENRIYRASQEMTDTEIIDTERWHTERWHTEREDIHREKTYREKTYTERRQTAPQSLKVIKEELPKVIFPIYFFLFTSLLFYNYNICVKDFFENSEI